MLRDLDLNRQNCNLHPSANPNINQIPLTNEHGDQFLRANNELDDCGPLSGEGYEDFPPNSHQQYYNNQRPSPVESDYFYDQYVDYPINDTIGNTLNNTATGNRLNLTSPFVDFNQNKFTNYQNLPVPQRPPPASQFTFFGQPLPSLSLGNLWGAGRTANNRATSAESSSTRGKGRVQIFRPGDPAISIDKANNNLDPIELELEKNREPAASSKNPIIDASVERNNEKFYRPYPYFQTPFSQPKPEKGFSPMIPGMTVGGFMPIQDPSRNETKANVKNYEWPKDDEEVEDDFKEIPLVTRSNVRPLIGHIDQVATTTSMGHLVTSLSPILSTLMPKIEILTEKQQVEEQESAEMTESSREIESRNTNKLDKMSFEEELYGQHDVSTQSTTSTTTSSDDTLTENRNDFQPSSTTTEMEPPLLETADNYEDEAEEIPEHQFNQPGSSSLSADHLIAPGSILPQDIPNAPVIIKSPSNAKAGKITKVFTPAPPVASNSNEISKLLSPFYPQQFSSEPPSSFDNEYQPNQIYTQTVTDNDATAQYDREDMNWYFTNYNHSQSTPILNYNLQPYDNYGHSTAVRTSCTNLATALALIVIKNLIL